MKKNRTVCLILALVLLAGAVSLPAPAALSAPEYAFGDFLEEWQTLFGGSDLLPSMLDPAVLDDFSVFRDTFYDAVRGFAYENLPDALAYIDAGTAAEINAMIALLGYDFMFNLFFDDLFEQLYHEIYAYYYAPSLSNFTKIQTYDNNFTDIDSHYAKDWIIKAYDYGIIAGSGNTYGTTNNMTVQDALVIASKMHGIYNNGAYDYSSHGAYPGGYITYALDNGLTDNRFDGEYTRPATRGELAYIWGNILPKSELQKLNDYAPFSDVPATHKYYEEIKLFYEAGIVTGSGGSFSPDSNVIRGDCAVMFVRLVSVTDRSGYKG